ncbi:LCP family protein [Bacillus alkalisoli]|uniref:LCP family protein n=1 Tax=Bacillus alkalisoli TaxID=2011008 RepID=UPI000C24E0AE|nr:LCP family protein [Bacillus alkalisoli]
MKYNARMEKRHKKKRRRFLLVLPLLFFIMMGLVYGSFITYKAIVAAGDAHLDLKRGGKSELRDKVVDPGKDNISVLFLGVDDGGSRNFGDSARTDAIMVATFNRKDKSVKMLSIPRDSYVMQPDRGTYDKINHAHAFHGIDGVVNTVEDLLDIPVDYYVRMNFTAFIEVVEALGGIEVDVPISFTEMDSHDRKNAISLEKGVQVINGEEALALARTRKLDNDIERGKRQQLIVQGIIKEAASVSSITSYGNVIDALGNNITTNMRFSQLVALHDYALGLSTESLSISGQDSRINGVYYYQLDEQSLAEVKRELRQHLQLN